MLGYVWIAELFECDRRLPRRRTEEALDHRGRVSRQGPPSVYQM